MTTEGNRHLGAVIASKNHKAFVHVEIASTSTTPSYAKKGFVVQRQEGVRNLLTSLLGIFCRKVEVEA